jgi:pyridoxine/pyridoxamine 5'-phosphate oxidase
MIRFDISEASNLNFVEALCWNLLSEGAVDRKSGMHNVVIGTSSGDLAILRTVILRRVDRDSKKIYFHTDSRSHKVYEISSSGILSWLAYDATQVSQIRLSGKTVVHHKDHLCKEHWALTAHHSRRAYMLPEGPGIEIIDPEKAMNPDLVTFNYSMEESETGWEHFVVVETQVDWMEWYFTHHRGNRKAVFQYQSNDLIKSGWYTP